MHTLIITQMTVSDSKREEPVSAHYSGQQPGDGECAHEKEGWCAYGMGVHKQGEPRDEQQRAPYQYVVDDIYSHAVTVKRVGDAAAHRQWMAESST